MYLNLVFLLYMFHYFIPSEGHTALPGTRYYGTHNSGTLLEGLQSIFLALKKNYDDHHTLSKNTDESKIKVIMNQSDSNLAQKKKIIIEHLTLQDSQKESLVPTFEKIDSICIGLIEQKMAFDALKYEYSEKWGHILDDIDKRYPYSHSRHFPIPKNQRKKKLKRAKLNNRFEKRIDSIKEFVSSYLLKLNEQNNGIIKLIMNYPEPKRNSISKGFEEFIRNIKDYADVFINKFNTFINENNFAQDKKLHPAKKYLHIAIAAKKFIAKLKKRERAKLKKK